MPDLFGILLEGGWDEAVSFNLVMNDFLRSDMIYDHLHTHVYKMVTGYSWSRKTSTINREKNTNTNVFFFGGEGNNTTLGVVVFWSTNFRVGKTIRGNTEVFHPLFFG